MSISVRVKRSALVTGSALALIAGALTTTAAGTAAALPGDTSLGAVTAFEADSSTYTLTAGSAKVRVAFLKDDVFRLWLAPDGTFTDPANTPPTDPNAPASNIVAKTDYGAPRTSWRDHGGYYSLKTDKIEVRANKSPLRFSLYRSNGQLVWSETAPLSWNDTSANQSLGRGANEQFFGGGMQNGRFSHRDQTIRISRDFNWEDGGNPNASPYYMSTAGYGVLRNTFSPGSYNFTDPVVTTHDGKRFDAYYFVGDLKTSLDRYTELTGRPFMPPIYGLEYGDSDCYNRGHYATDPDPSNDWKVHPDKVTTLDAVKVAQRFRDEDMPGGWMLVNDDYGCGYSDDTESEQVGGTWWGKREIPPLKQTGDELRSRNIEMGLWTQSSLDRQPAEVGEAGVRVRKLDVAWVGPGYRHALSACDTAHGGIEQYSNARGFAWMVEGWAGAQRCAVQWTGDHSGSLDAIRWQIPAITGSGNSGIAYSAGDVDGIFGGSGTSYTRDLQWKVFNPAFMTMSGWATPAYKHPWTYGEPYTSINRKYLKLRERLLPYFYSYAAEAHRTGAPLNRSLVLEYPNDPNTWGDAAKYEFLAGKEFLVAPMWGADEVKSGIYLPKGRWIDYWSGKVYQGPTTVNGYHAPLDTLPLFVKAGAVVPMWKSGINAAAEQAFGDRVTVDIYPEGKSSFSLYEDDRVTRDYKEAKSATQRLEVDAPIASRGDITVKIGASRGLYTSKPATRPYELTVHTGTAPSNVSIGDGKLTKLASKDAYLAASTGWYYENGVVLVKTPSISTSGDATVRLSDTTSVGGGKTVTDTFGIPELVTPSLWNAPGQATEVTASFKNAGTTTMRDVRLVPNLPAGWTSTGTSTFAAVEPGKSVTTKLQVIPGADVKPASFTLRLDASYRVHDNSYVNSAVATAQLPYASLSQAANVVGISNASTYAQGNFDGSGNSFYGEALAAAGYTPGATLTVQGAEFTWPTGAPGTPNLVKNQSAPILVTGTGSHLALLGAGASLNAKGSVTILYTDGTQSQAPLQLPNWCCQDPTTGGAKLAVGVKGRYTQAGLANTTTDYRVFYTAVPLTPGKTAKAIKLPGGGLGFFAATLADKPLPPAPTGQPWVSDLEWIDSTNGWGPVERDRSNGEDGAADGGPLTLDGTQYAKGLGTHAPSTVSVRLAGNCSLFTAKVGVDDEMEDRGKVSFKVLVDSVTKYTSELLTGTSPTAPVSVDVSGGQTLTLQVTDAGDGITSDHADWAEARLTCANP
ncbi:alpha-glucosidase (family GH31 glycosyl hydrolase) [Kribbella sp. VKM Ac-2527]|uniref:Alpha-glucosidase (Family GH31 glycosyl hydrolase) n=1 Tax=Kribbella caucasensis TaxID=2512215 RepID=A0A4R6KIG5_9ACTN|nr:NPCBM/NEW2 domain-containing protein [Kribbella sp. VKM Ac-2527]TDO50824.1 alpha-glucosidase (family GH31 glycosyl hydrolase) [Kribbella sp. VKM Ac-2527]